MLDPRIAAAQQCADFAACGFYAEPVGYDLARLCAELAPEVVLVQQQQAPACKAVRIIGDEATVPVDKVKSLGSYGGGYHRRAGGSGSAELALHPGTVNHRANGKPVLGNSRFGVRDVADYLNLGMCLKPVFEILVAKAEDVKFNVRRPVPNKRKDLGKEPLHRVGIVVDTHGANKTDVFSFNKDSNAKYSNSPIIVLFGLYAFSLLSFSVECSYMKLYANKSLK